MRHETRNILKGCLHCGKQFLAARNTSKFCSINCRVAYSRLRNNYVICVALNKEELANYRKVFPNESNVKILVQKQLLFNGVLYKPAYMVNIEKKYFFETCKAVGVAGEEFKSYVTSMNEPTKKGNMAVHLEFIDERFKSYVTSMNEPTKKGNLVVRLK